jgi:hypothetical protein
MTRRSQFGDTDHGAEGRIGWSRVFGARDGGECAFVERRELREAESACVKRLRGIDFKEFFDEVAKLAFGCGFPPPCRRGWECSE